MKSAAGNPSNKFEAQELWIRKKEGELSKKTMATQNRILITGATRGIGLAVARRFARGGYALALTARTPADLERVGEELRGLGAPPALLLAADLGAPEGIRQVAGEVLRQWGQPDIVVNNAGQFAAGAVLDAPDGQLEQLMRLNLYAPYRLTRALAPAMLRAGRGQVINICSIAGREVFAGRGAYAMTKHALLAFSRTLQLELQDSGLRVTTILPGPTATSSWEGADLPPGALLDPDDVAAAVWTACRLGPDTVAEEIVLQPRKRWLGG